ncbi:hypothetical protein ACERIT_06620 [Halopenitus sp. H-Gu1]|uniref:hypothetical protein n=1 Tax=Halopenitus sp. H-Gu1 TaxID=3242697 RepID=UPI00359E1F76
MEAGDNTSGVPGTENRVSERLPLRRTVAADHDGAKPYILEDQEPRIGDETVHPNIRYSISRSMSRDLSLGNFLRELGFRLTAAGVVVGMFFGLGYVNRLDLFGLSSVLDTQFAFFAVAFGLVVIASVIWIGFQQYRG